LEARRAPPIYPPGAEFCISHPTTIICLLQRAWPFFLSTKQLPGPLSQQQQQQRPQGGTLDISSDADGRGLPFQTRCRGIRALITTTNTTTTTAARAPPNHAYGIVVSGVASNYSVIITLLTKLVRLLRSKSPRTCHSCVSQQSHSQVFGIPIGLASAAGEVGNLLPKVPAACPLALRSVQYRSAALRRSCTCVTCQPWPPWCRLLQTQL
jgi:hypothetical protein